MSARILIVDDDPWILRMVSTLLEKRGFHITSASDGHEALERASERRPDLIITDVMMPGMDGWTLVRTLRARKELALIPVIFLTALGGDEDRIRGFRLGADDYLPKPFRFEELDLRVSNALKKHEATRATQEQVAKAAEQKRDEPPGKRSGIHGLLEQLGLSSLLVMVEMERKSGILCLERAGATGRLFVKQGRVLAARLDGEDAPPDAAKGPNAVYHLLTWAHGTFSFTAVDVDMDDEIQASTTNLLMEGARLIDENNR